MKFILSVLSLLVFTFEIANCNNYYLNQFEINNVTFKELLDSNNVQSIRAYIEEPYIDVFFKTDAELPRPCKMTGSSNSLREIFNTTLTQEFLINDYLKESAFVFGNLTKETIEYGDGDDQLIHRTETKQSNLKNFLNLYQQNYENELTFQFNMPSDLR
jgi:hypothetical protein